MTNWTIFKIIFFHFYLYSSVLSHIYFLHIKNPLYNVKKTSNIEKNLFSLYFWGAVFSKITNSNAQKWVIFRKKIFTAKLVLDILATFWGAYFLKCHRRPTLVPIWPSVKNPVSLHTDPRKEKNVDLQNSIYKLKTSTKHIHASCVILPVMAI